jgi:hypothetical protein
MDRAVDEQEVQAIRQHAARDPGVCGVHDVRTRKMGDMIVVDAHLEVDAAISVEAGHDIAVEARQRVLQRHRVLNLMTHIDPWRGPTWTMRRAPACPHAEGRLPAGGVLLAQFALEHLADGAARQLAHQVHGAQALGLADARIQPVLQGLGRNGWPSRATTKATGVSPHSSEGTPTTAPRRPPPGARAAGPPGRSGRC